jgi:signal transduction histidine kinase
MRIRSKLGLILVIPLLAVMVFAGFRLLDSGQRAVSAGLVRSLAEVSAEASQLGHELHRERMAAAVLLTNQADGSGDFNAQASRTDRAVVAYRTARDGLGQVPDPVQARLQRVDQQLGTLGTIRQEILGENPVAVSAAALRYGVIISDLIAYQESVGQATGDPQLAESVRAIAALSKAKVQLSQAQVTGYLALQDGSLDEEEVTSFVTSQTAQQEALLAFTLAASPDQLAVVNSVFSGSAVALAEQVGSRLARAVGDEEPAVIAEQLHQAFGAIVNLVRYAEQQLHAGQVAAATELRDAVLRQVLLESAAVLAILFVAILIASLLARALARSLGRLRDGALTVANRELPQTVARFSDPQTLGQHTPAEIASQVRDPIQLRSRDEVGEVAQAFNVVHQATVRVAAEQAALRTSVSAMFLNLARRSQALVDRMINQLDEIERNEEDPKRLSRLFSLDHLATRMRRNDENLLVLAGADSSPPRSDDAQLADVLRAAQSEVEHYDRIEFGTIDSDVSVVAQTVNDVVRLVAELFDNATRYSPPDAPVVAEARRLGDQVIVQIEDQGVGMPQDQVNQLNAWLAAPPGLEFTTFRRMGLAVVGRLATRHHIRVELRSDSRTCTIAYVALPPTILVLPQHRMRSAEIPLPRTPVAAERAPAPPPVPARLVGQLPRRSAEVVSHARKRGGRATGATGTMSANHNLADQPVAGRPPESLIRTINHLPPTPSPVRPHDSTVEMPIFREMEAVWFRSHGGMELDQQASAGTSSSRRSGDSTVSNATTARASTGGGDTAGTGAAPGYATTSEEWRTPADSGWSAAAAATQPPMAGSTRSGLPKRVPQAQYVPGGVEASSGTPANQRRSPDEVRGLLSAYHRGVQRGREHGGR